mmetsp:Transcript_17889/g.54714  ORF Transcript_17889/g.54714 Transcript_17889/m.54714 type:complete len:373 (+) Transcript_17889:141-1259(+)
MAVVVVFYVSGHGLGHATRAIAIMAQLLRLGLERLVVVAPAQRDFYRRGLGDAFEFYERACDAQLVQTSALRVDAAASLAAYEALDRAAILERERQFLRSHGADLVVSDVAAVPLRAAADLGIPSAVVSNFLWLDIYAGMRTALLDGAAADRGEPDWLATLREDYYASRATYLQLPGGDDQAIAQPLVARLSRSSRRETRRDLLGVPEEDSVALLTFGGHALPSFGNATLPPRWHCVVLGVDGSALPPRFVAAPRDAYVPDLVNAADVVLGKLGYGTVSECLAHHTPLVYVPRQLLGTNHTWPEERHLVRLLGGTGLRLDEDDFFQGRWPLERARDLRPPPGSDDGATCEDDDHLPAARVARALLQLLPSSR